ncbi:hypothetical protein J3B02_004203, partial [Coemansia erecta]
MNMRPQFCGQLLEKLTEWYAVINSSGQTLTHSQLVIIGKTLRIMLLHLYTRKHMSGYAEELESTLDRIGGPDWAAWQERQAREKERKERQRIRDRETLARQQQGSRQQSRFPSGRDGSGQQETGAQRHLSAMDRGGNRQQQQQQQQKRISRFAEDEDEEYQSRMLEENAKRVKLENKAEDGSLLPAQPSPSALSNNPAIVQQSVTENDKEMEAEVRRAINTGPFELQVTLHLSAAERELLVVDAMKRIVAGSKAIERFIASNRVQSLGGVAGLAKKLDPLRPRALGTTELGAQPTLSNGLSTNAGVLEDSILLLVRMISNCYMISFNPVLQETNAEDIGPSSKWADMHACIEIPAAPVIDRLALDFILDVPYLSDVHFKKLEQCLRSPATAALGFWTIEKAMDMRPPLFKAGINSLLTFSVSHDRVTRIGCIRAVKKYFTTSQESGLIEKFAQTSFKRGVQNAEATMVKIKDDITKIRTAEPTVDQEAAAQREADLAKLKLKGDQEIDMELATHGEILLALCTRKMELLSVVFDAYVPASTPVRLGFVRLIGPLIKSVSGTPAKILPALSNFPLGAETLAIKVIKVLALESAAVPSKELVQGILEMQAQRSLDPRFIVAVAMGLKKTEALEWIGKVVGLLDGNGQRNAIVRDFFSQLTTSFPGRPSVLSPTELL